MSKNKKKANGGGRKKISRQKYEELLRCLKNPEDFFNKLEKQHEEICRANANTNTAGVESEYKN